MSKFWKARGDLTVMGGLLLYGTHIVVPVKLALASLVENEVIVT